MFTNVAIDGNTISSSWSASLGQIMLQAFSGCEISARIANNVVVDGAGYGMLCTGGGAFALTDLTTNTFVNNAAGNTNGCQ
jgi:hypothetical protein